MGVEDNSGAPDRAAAAAAAAAVVNRYLDAFYAGDHDSAGSVLAEDFSFEGPFVEVRGRDAFLASAEGLRAFTRGHALVRQWIDEREIVTIYDVRIETPAHVGDVRMSEWHTVDHGHLVAGRVFFDSARLRALLQPPGAPTDPHAPPAEATSA